MILEVDVLSNLVADIYDAAIDPDLWSATLAGIYEFTARVAVHKSGSIAAS